ncbi:2-oxoglutarate dehydrogenase [Salpingoeca rosetta]|uniref:2-oxoglutarate dehydrogenase, mitochondrial n=1 Tax=Salpingoeca rosetta (strain ATCC 50818 / BSB-021) TaxID=946362 RepID=F2UL04_SALR5|nr:2-oxoglutarate dehydrogenase [Salpingoeca rosetta]EGD77803.1 2-oxoglutarate dehydrogenase [Salpingoeca rosetta]|eukprot:XP_004990279.1 2-oxoglutarate dehydrogenase [Salpingoeca rosetta]
MSRFLSPLTRGLRGAAGSAAMPASSRMTTVRAHGVATSGARASAAPMSPIAHFVRALASQPSPTEAFLNGTSTPYVEAMHEEWKKDPNSVHASWRKFFELEGKGYGKGASYTPPPGMNAATPLSPEIAGDMSLNDILAHVKVERLIRAYEVRGHNIADLDPLGILHADLDGDIPPELQLDYYHFTEADLNREIVLAPRPIFNDASKMTLRDIIATLKRVFCRDIGFEFMFIQERDRVLWLQEQIKNSDERYSPEKRKDILTDLIHAGGFEDFLKKKYVSEKRFGIEGCESLIAGMKSMLFKGHELGVEYAVLGMPHRGRLNILHNVMQKRGEVIFNEFASRLEPDDEGSGDVKYHLGMSSDISFPNREGTMHLSLMANPSHLEAVNPVVEGKARAEQEYRGDTERKKVIPILLHGDAAFAGQGVVYESLGLASLPAYTTGGTIHIIVNNQIGFTTDPRLSRSTPYCTDVAKMLGAPIFHVNGDDPEAVVRCCELAMEWRQQYGTDVVVDIVCYRRHGHNEADQPAFTQPLMYERIGKQKPTPQLYANRLLEEGVVDQAWIDEVAKEYEQRLATAFDNAPSFTNVRPEYFGSRWNKHLVKLGLAPPRETGVDIDTLKTVGVRAAEYPDDFTVHKALKKVLAARRESAEAGEGIDWATAESLAFGTLLLEGTHVRLSGQDVERGTFSHRHHVLHDQKEDKRLHTPLQHLAEEGQTNYTVSNSHLSEYAALGFELGYSQAHPNQLVCWEAQFGDFHNTAQCIIDQFIVSGEHKWKRQSGLVMLLPHGYEGMGPEHSSARLERFLQLSNEDESEYPPMARDARKQIQLCNIQVLNCTTPANYFHALRRQVYRDFRKPLVMMTPKSLLRHPLCKSSFEEMKPNTRFRRFIPEEDDNVLANQNIRRLVLCSGKVYYDLLQHREENNITDVAIGRVEQISPFPFDLVHKHADDFPNAEIVWCQEEPRNMGAWTYVRPRIETALSKSTHHAGDRPRYIGRTPSASVATGDKKTHHDEQVKLVSEALE